MKNNNNKDRNKIGKEKKINLLKADVDFSCHLSIDVATKILPHQFFI